MNLIDAFPFFTDVPVHQVCHFSYEFVNSKLLAFSNFFPFYMIPDPTIVGYLGMKGLVDLRVADMLAKQAALQLKASVFQSHVAQHESDKSVLYKNRAEENSNPVGSWFKKASPLAVMPFKIPHSSTWYEPSVESIMSLGKHSVAARQPVDSVLTTMKIRSLPQFFLPLYRISPSYANFI